MRGRNHLGEFLQEFWFAPQDAFLRAAEALIWEKIELDKPVLDIGIGDARISKLLFINKDKIDVGVDINEAEIKTAKKSKVYKKVLVADATILPFKPKSFQTVISNSTFEHIQKDMAAVKEVSRVLKKNGTFVLTVPTKRLDNNLKKIIANREKFNTFNQRVSHFHYRTLNDWKTILRKNNLKIDKHQYYFPKRAVETWYKMFRIVTFKPYKRELWSYLKDSLYGKIVPHKATSFLLEKYLNPSFKSIFDSSGNWVYIKAIKTK